MTYARNAKKGRTVNTKPTRTDQSQAQETDINVIINQFMKTGQATGPAENPMYEDFTEMPTDLRGFIRRIPKSRKTQKRPAGTTATPGSRRTPRLDA